MTTPPPLSNAARIALMSLRDHPRRGTPEAISSGPYSIQQIDAAAVYNGLVELEAQGLAQESHGSWKLTEAGRTHGA